MAVDEGPPAATDVSAADRRSGFVRHKKHIGPLGLTVLTAVGCLPLLLVLARVLALPWAESLPAILDPLRAFGETLNQDLTLDWVPPSDRARILHLLLLPTAALIVTVARLTFGIRVLGLRAILIGMGFRAIGMLPSLTLMLFVVCMTLLIRPWIRRIRLPMYGRIGVILCLSASIMVGALLVAPWVGSEAIWSVAFFPVIIMAMLAESIAKTLEQDDVVMAVWRAGWTIVMAVFIALVGAEASKLSYHFPELILTEFVAIIVIGEFFDLRLFEEWPARLSRYFAGTRPWYSDRPKVAVVRNRDPAGVVAQLGRPAPAGHRKQSVQRHVDALREVGFRVKVFEGDIKLLSQLNQFLAPSPRHGTPSGIVLNLATGIQGEGRFSHVPAMLEMAGLPYTGPDPLAHARLADRFTWMTLLSRAKVLVPRHFLIDDPIETADIEFPAAARPRFEPDAKRTIVRNHQSLRDAVRAIRRSYDQPALVEEIIDGRRITAALVGNDSIECLPLIERSSGRRGRTCPAPLDETLAERVRECARAAYRAAGCRDYARIDIRLSPFDEPIVVDIRWNTAFEPKGTFDTAAKAAGYSFTTLMQRIVREAAARYVTRADQAVSAQLEPDASSSRAARPVAGTRPQ